MEVQDFSNAVSSLLHRFDDVFTEPGFRRLVADFYYDMCEDLHAHGESLDEPYYNFWAFKGVAIFTFFETQFSIFAIRCNEPELIAETEQFALADTEACRNYLTSRFQKSEPDLVAPRSVCEQWLGI